MIKGSGLKTRQADEERFVQGSGWTTVEVWEGPETAIRSEAHILALTGNYSDIDVSAIDNVQFRLRASRAGAVGSEEEFINTWELIGQIKQEDIYNHPNSRAISDENIGNIKLYARDPSLRINSSPPLTGATIAGAVQLWNLVKNDQLHYQDSYYALRHTLTLNTFAQVNASMANVNRLHTLEQLPSGITPSVLQAITNIPAPDPVPDDFVFQWLKQTPQITASINARPQVQEEWWLDLWPTFLYNLAQ